MKPQPATNPQAQKTAAVIVAAGRGQRAGGSEPKQWATLSGQTVAWHTLRALTSHAKVGSVIVVHHPEDGDHIARLSQDFVFTPIPGGQDRAGSVQAGLQAAAMVGASQVLIHDVARPGLPHAVIDRVLAALELTAGAAPALAVTDALWRGAQGRVAGTVDRAGLFRAQTPQGFHLDAILAAHQTHPGGAADDVEVARAAGLDVTIVDGDEANLKITYPGDFDRAAAILRNPS